MRCEIEMLRRGNGEGREVGSGSVVVRKVGQVGWRCGVMYDDVVLQIYSILCQAAGKLGANPHSIN